MRHFDDPGQMTAGQRFNEIASILATGLLRLKKSPESLLESRQICEDFPESDTSALEDCGETRLTVRAG